MRGGFTQVNEHAQPTSAAEAFAALDKASDQPRRPGSDEYPHKGTPGFTDAEIDELEGRGIDTVAAAQFFELATDITHNLAALLRFDPDDDALLWFGAAWSLYIKGRYGV